MSRVTCECGAVYERTEDKVAFRDSDSFQCRVCGHEMESWNGSRIPHFQLIQAPEVDGNGQS